MFTILLDAPDSPASRLQIATLGDFEDGRYGAFSITRDDVASWQRNLEHLPGKRALIDLDHRADRTPRNTEAAGWITGIGWNGNTPVADVEWTPVGEKAIAEKRYLFFSPTYGDHKTEDGAVHENTLIGGALTNRPFLSSMPAVTLAAESTIEAAITKLEAELAAENHARLLDVLSTKQRNNLDESDFAIPSQRAYPIKDLAHARNALARVAQVGTDSEKTQVQTAVYKRFPQLKPSADSSDSRRAMDTALLTALGIEDPDAIKALQSVEVDETLGKTLLDAANGLKAKAEEHDPKGPRTLEQQAADAGKVILDSAQFDKFAQRVKDATAAIERVTTLETSLKTLEDQRAEERFDAAFDAALRDPAGAKVSPAERDNLKHFYTLDAAKTLAMIEARAPIVHARPTGRATLELDAADVDPRQVAAAGVHPDSHALDQKIRTHMLDNKIGEARYGEIAEQVFEGKLAL